VNHPVAGEFPTLLAAGEKLRKQMLFLTGSMFGIAAIALVAIAATVSMLYSADDESMRVVTTTAILAEIVLLLLVISSIRARLIRQATEVLQHKDAMDRQAATLRKQADALEISNRELAAAIQEKDAARAFAEEQAAEQGALFNALTEVFFVLDRDGTYQKVAPGNDELLVRSRDELLGKNVQEMLPAPVAALAMTSIGQALETRRRVDVEYSLDLHGKTTWFSGTVMPLGDDRVLWVARDISEAKL